MEESNFDKLLNRYLTNRASEKEVKEIEAWLEIQKTKKPLDHEYSAEEEEKIYQYIVGKRKTLDVKVPSSKTRYLNAWSMGIAATILLIVSISIVLWNQSRSGEIEKMILSDGTIVWLKRGGQLTFSESADGKTRNAELLGEALFEVSKDPSRPFSIRQGDMIVRVLGTSFNLKMTKDSVYLEVLTGKVKLLSSTDSTGVLVLAKEKVVTSHLQTVEEQALTKADVTAITKATEYDMQFTGSDIDQIFSRIEQKFEVEIKLPADYKGGCVLKADFTDQSLERTFEMLSEVIELKYSINDNTVLISQIDCN